MEAKNLMELACLLNLQDSDVKSKGHSRFWCGESREKLELYTGVPIEVI